jgi:hypothetical protein
MMGIDGCSSAKDNLLSSNPAGVELPHVNPCRPRSAPWMVLNALTLVCACTSDIERVEVTVQRTDSMGIEMVDVSGPLQALPTLTLRPDPTISIVGSQAPYLSDVGSVAWLEDGRLLVEDRQSVQLHLFAADGHYVRTLSDRGDGPGEFRSISTISVGPNDTIYVYDGRQGRLSVFDADAGFLRSRRFLVPPDDQLPTNVWHLARDTFVIYAQWSRGSSIGPFPRRDEIVGYLAMHDGGGGIVTAPLALRAGFSIETVDQEIYAAYSPRPVVGVSPGHVVYSEAAKHTFTVLDQALRPLRIVRWPELDLPIPEAEVDSVRRIARRWYSEAGAPLDRARFLANTIVAIRPDIRPAFGGIVVDDVGRIWLARFTPDAPGWPDATVWYALDATGVPIGLLRLPSRTSLIGVSGGSVLLAIRDSLDVPRLEAREILEFLSSPTDS